MTDKGTKAVSKLNTPKGIAAEINAIFDGEPPDRVRGAVERMAQGGDLHYLWAIYDTLRLITLPIAERLAFVSVRLLVEDETAQGESIDLVGEAIEAIHSSTLRRTKTPPDVALRASYRLLHNRLASWDDATALANHQLKKPITKDAWRRRVGRWAERQGLETVRIYSLRANTSI